MVTAGYPWRAIGSRAGGGVLGPAVSGGDWERGAARRVLLLALNTRRARAVSEDAAFLLARGIGVDLLTVNPQPWEDAGLPAAVRCWSLREGEGRHPLPRGERLLVYRAPRKLLGLLRQAAAPHYARPDLGRPLELAVALLTRGHAKLADGFHHRVFIRGYRVVRPYLLWRIADRHPGGPLVSEATELVVVYDTHAVPTAWHLARRHPQLAVSLGFDRAPYEDLPAPKPEPTPEPEPVPLREPEPVPEPAEEAG